MNKDVFIELAEALDQLPNGYPRSDSGVELRILKKIFSPEEAALAGKLTGAFEPVRAIAGRLGLPEEEVSRRLFKLVRGGLAWLDKRDGKAYFRLAPFVIGIYEAQRELLDHELAFARIAATALSAARWAPSRKGRVSRWLTEGAASAAGYVLPAVRMRWPGWCASRRPRSSILQRISLNGSMSGCIIED